MVTGNKALGAPTMEINVEWTFSRYHRMFFCGIQSKNEPLWARFFIHNSGIRMVGTEC